MRFIVSLVMLGISLTGFSQTKVDLHIVEGTVETGNGPIPYFNFNTRNVFDSTNAILKFKPGDEVEISITNHVNFTCGFEIVEHGKIDRIESNETKTITITFNEVGTFLYQSPIKDHRALGLGGMVVVSDFEGDEYYGVFAEHESSWINALSEGGEYSRLNYNPSAFTINGFGFPRTMMDTNSYVRGKVGDTILIHMTNAGLMYHFPHFHGYHVTILRASVHSIYEGWDKDSFGMAPGESVTVRLIPDKPGRYPIHNHNLVTTTFGGNYPGGMMMHLDIDE